MLEPKFYEWKKASIPLVAQSQSVTNNNSRLTSSKLPTLFSPVHIPININEEGLCSELTQTDLPTLYHHY